MEPQILEMEGDNPIDKGLRNGYTQNYEGSCFNLYLFTFLLISVLEVRTQGKTWTGTGVTNMSCTAHTQHQVAAHRQMDASNRF